MAQRTRIVTPGSQFTAFIGKLELPDLIDQMSKFRPSTGKQRKEYGGSD